MNADEKDELLIRIDERTKNLDEKFDSCILKNKEIDDRLTAVEKWQWKATGIASAVSAFGGSLAGIFLGRGGP